MESNIKSSFIPKDTAQLTGRAPAYSRSGLNDILVLLGIVLMVVSVALGAGVFLYAQFLESSLNSKKEQLERAQAAFEPNLIAELTRLDDRMKIGEDLLEKHTAPSILFALFEQLTLETVSFRDFQYDATQDEAINIKMRGLAQSVNSIALQADILGKHPAISSPLFTNIGREEAGVRFDLAATVKPSALRYTNLVSGAAAGGATTDTTGAQPTPSPEGSSVPLFAP